MHAVRRWSVRNSAFLEKFYMRFERLLIGLDPLWRLIGYGRAEKPMRALERRVKRLLFGCRMCGQCILRHTGMSCPMNCPKKMRNGPCGGVRADGNCEVKASTPCPWIGAWEGSRRMAGGGSLSIIQKPINQDYWGKSSWLRVARGDTAGMPAPSAKPPPGKSR